MAIDAGAGLSNAERSVETRAGQRYGGPIVDAHHHVWLRERVPWLNGPMQPRIFGHYEAIRRDYTIGEFRVDSAPSGVVASVYVQVNVAPGEEVGEVEWVESLSRAGGHPSAIVAFADLARPDLDDLLDRHLAAGRVRGIRQQLHWHENPLYRFAARPDIMNDPAWRRGLARVAARGLLFELQVFESQFADCVALARAVPEATLVLMHAGMPEDLSDEGFARWRDGMQRLAAEPNVHVKLSGLGTFVHRLDPVLIESVSAATIDAFGPERCLFGSNFPIEKLWTGYAELVDAWRDALSGLDAAAQHAIFHDNAVRLYRLTQS